MFKSSRRMAGVKPGEAKQRAGRMAGPAGAEGDCISPDVTHEPGKAQG